MPILCSKTLKTAVPKAKSAQKPRFCARKERGVGNSSARNLALGGLREAPGAGAVLPKWGYRGGAAQMGVPRRKRALLLGLDFQRGAVWGNDGLPGLRGAEMANDVVGREFAL